VNLIDYRHLAVLLYPSKMLYPGILPLVSMFDALFRDVAGAQRKVKLFWIAFFWLVTSCNSIEQKLDLIFESVTASFSGSCSRSGCSLFSQGFPYFALRIRGRQTSRESLEAPMEMKDLVYCRSASTGSIFQQVRVPPKMCYSYLNYLT